MQNIADALESVSTKDILDVADACSWIRQMEDTLESCLEKDDMSKDELLGQVIKLCGLWHSHLSVFLIHVGQMPDHEIIEQNLKDLIVRVR